MKNKKELCMAFTVCAAGLALFIMTGCKGVDYVKFSNTIPGKYNLSGVSKVAIADFNTMPNDPVRGIYAVDNDTRQIVENMVATKFFKGKTYKITDLDVEKAVFDTNGAAAKLAQRADAIAYGRVWWKLSPEYKNIHPVVHNLEKWYFEKYMCGRTNSGEPIYATARLLDTTTDVKMDHKYRACNATLMFSLTLYRLDRNGQIEKIVEDFAVADQAYLLDNGEFATVFIPHGKVELSKIEQIAAKSENKDAKAQREKQEKAGFLNANQCASTIPTPLQTKIMLGQKLTEQIGRKMVNTEIPIEAEFFGKYLFFAPINEELLKVIIAGNYVDARKSLVTEIRKATGYALSDMIGSLSAYEKETVEVAKDSDLFEDLKNAKTSEDKAEIEEEIAELLEDAVDDLENEIYALAVCEEACGKYDYALENYRILLKYSAEERYALGISRCLVSLNMVDRLQAVAKDAKKASKKASLK